MPVLIYHSLYLFKLLAKVLRRLPVNRFKSFRRNPDILFHSIKDISDLIAVNVGEELKEVL